MPTGTDITDRIRQPEYTGVNRCSPCTVVNVVIGIVLGGLAWLVLGGLLGTAAGAMVLGVSAVLIYLRGYLVPGTPTLTKRYLPGRVLRWFDKEHSTPVAPTEIDTEATLVEAGVLEECVDRDDLCLTTDFELAWRSEMTSMTAAGDAIDLSVFMTDAEWSGLDRSEIDVERHGDAYTVSVDGGRLAQWESSVAFTADRAAAILLEERVENWDQLGFAARTELVGALRLWLTECPSCGRPVAPDQNTVESCCREVSVIAISCDVCDHRLFEVEFDAADAAAV